MGVLKQFPAVGAEFPVTFLFAAVEPDHQFDDLLLSFYSGHNLIVAAEDMRLFQFAAVEMEVLCRLFLAEAEVGHFA